MSNPRCRTGSAVLAAALAFQFTACGTIIYPERRGQTSGRIDVGVALLDGFWLLVGIIPGLIAFAVDFTSGAIYLPPGSADAGDDEVRIVRFNPETTDRAEIEAIIRRETGEDFTFSGGTHRLVRVEGESEALEYLRNSTNP